MITTYEAQYCQLISDIITRGVVKETRNGPTFSLFGTTLTLDSLEWGMFPLLHGRKMFYEGVLGEFAAFIRGPKHINDFKSQGCNYWDAWADSEGKINVDYGNSWIDYNGVNQIAETIKSLQDTPESRRHVISGWRPDKLQSLSLPCCHMLYQWYHNPTTNTLDMIFYMRSVDVMVGLPSDVILAAILNILMAREVHMNPGKLILMLGDTHIYDNHHDATMEYLGVCKELANDSTDPKTPYKIRNFDTIYNFKAEDFELKYYQPRSPIKFELNV